MEKALASSVGEGAARFERLEAGKLACETKLAGIRQQGAALNDLRQLPSHLHQVPAHVAEVHSGLSVEIAPKLAQAQAEIEKLRQELLQPTPTTSTPSASATLGLH